MGAETGDGLQIHINEQATKFISWSFKGSLFNTYG